MHTKRNHHLRPIVPATFDVDTHIPLKEAAQQTGYNPTYLNGTGSARYGLTRFSSPTVPMFFLKSQIDKLTAAMTNSTNGRGSSKLNGSRPRPARLPVARRSNNGNHIPPVSVIKPTITVVAGLDTIRSLLEEGFGVRLEVISE